MAEEGDGKSLHLQRHQSIVHQDLLGEEIGTYCGLVACTELLVDLNVHHVSVLSTATRPRTTYILIHQARLANPTIAENNDLFEPRISAVTKPRDCSRALP